MSADKKAEHLLNAVETENNTANESAFPEWQRRDRLFHEKDMYALVEAAASKHAMVQTAAALPLMLKHHEGQYRKGRDRIPYIYHPLMMACHALSLGIGEDALIATILLHDVVEDCGVGADELDVSDEIRCAVQLLTYDPPKEISKQEAKREYFRRISENRLAAVAKVIDRCNNLSTMATGFTRERMIRYIHETEEMIMPILDSLPNRWPEYEPTAFLLKYQMRSLLETIKRLI